MRGSCAIKLREVPRATPSPDDDASESSIVSPFCTESCLQHGSACRPLRLSRLPGAGAAPEGALLHDWAADLHCAADLATAELPFSVGFDNYCAYFESKALVARLKQVADLVAGAGCSDRRQHSPSTGIEPSRFYTSSRRSVLAAFSRQEEAFQFCDSNLDLSLKVFSFESESMQGRRRFVAAELSEFVRRYSRIAPSERHVYEIIREGYPCRAYLDLEFSKESNPGADGERMVQKVVHLLCWKVFELFGLFVGPQHAVELDSSDAAKFSRHITLLIPCPGACASQGATAGARCVPPGPGETLFESNFAVGRLVAAVVEATLDPRAATDIGGGGEPGQASAALIDGTALPLTAVLPAYRDLWVRSKDGRLVCFIDTGVYSRNRAFRLLSSCKYGKSTVLRVSDNKIYNSSVRARYRSLDSPGSGRPCAQRHLADRLRAALEASFVVPAEVTAASVLAEKATRDDAAAAWGAVCPGARLRWTRPAQGGSGAPAGLPCIVPPANVTGAAGQLSPLVVGSMLPLPRPRPDAATEMRRYLRRMGPALAADTAVWSADGAQAGSALGGHTRVVRGVLGGAQAHSPFPALDEFVGLHISRGGVPGSIGSWAMTVTENPATYMSDVSSASGDPVAASQSYHITYQITGNKFCARVGRQHKSNHIMFVVDCGRECMYQKCWDPDCRGFSSNEIRVPSAALPSEATLQASASKAQAQEGGAADLLLT